MSIALKFLWNQIIKEEIFRIHLCNQQSGIGLQVIPARLPTQAYISEMYTIKTTTEGLEKMFPSGSGTSVHPWRVLLLLGLV